MARKAAILIEDGRDLFDAAPLQDAPAFAPLSIAFSGVALLTRALAARHDRDLTISVDAGEAQTPEAHLDAWRQMAICIAEFALTESALETLTLTFRACAYASGLQLSVDLPDDIRLNPGASIADRVLLALDGSSAAAPAPSADRRLDRVDALADGIGAAMAVERLPDGRVRLIVTSRPRPALSPLTRKAPQPVRKTARKRAA